MLDSPSLRMPAIDFEGASAPLSLTTPSFDALHDPAGDYRVPSLLRKLLRQQHTRWFALLAAFELALLVAAQALAIVVCERLGLATGAAATVWIPVAGTWVTMLALGLYQRHAGVEQDMRLAQAARIVVSLATGAILLLSWDLVAGSRVASGMLGVSFLASLALLALSRLAFSRLGGKEMLRRRTLFLGAGKRASEVMRTLKLQENDSVSRSVHIVGYVPLSSDEIALADARRLRPRGPLVEFALASEVDEIVIAADDRRRTLPMAELVNCRLEGIEVINLEAFYERELGKTALELLLPSWCVFTQAFDTSTLRRMSKRAFDTVASSVLLLLTWPLMIGVALAILFESRGRGPVLYAQERVGRNGAGFRLYKFRSMRTDAEIDGIARFAGADDARITRVGRVIRKFRLDELPQLWNVLKGEMSVVGPRPERPPFVQGFIRRVPHYGLRHCVRPGLTGWAQLRFPYGASEEDTIEKLRYDLYYVKYQGFAFDLAILLQTVEVVLFGRGGR